MLACMPAVTVPEGSLCWWSKQLSGRNSADFAYQATESIRVSKRQRAILPVGGYRFRIVPYRFPVVLLSAHIHPTLISRPLVMSRVPAMDAPGHVPISRGWLACVEETRDENKLWGCTSGPNPNQRQFMYPEEALQNPSPFKRLCFLRGIACSGPTMFCSDSENRAVDNLRPRIPILYLSKSCSTNHLNIQLRGYTRFVLLEGTEQKTRAFGFPRKKNKEKKAQP